MPLSDCAIVCLIAIVMEEHGERSCTLCDSAREGGAHACSCSGVPSHGIVASPGHIKIDNVSIMCASFTAINDQELRKGTCLPGGVAVAGGAVCCAMHVRRELLILSVRCGLLWNGRPLRGRGFSVLALPAVMHAWPSDGACRPSIVPPMQV